MGPIINVSAIIGYFQVAIKAAKFIGSRKTQNIRYESLETLDQFSSLNMKQCANWFECSPLANELKILEQRLSELFVLFDGQVYDQVYHQMEVQWSVQISHRKRFETLEALVRQRQFGIEQASNAGGSIHPGAKRSTLAGYVCSFPNCSDGESSEGMLRDKDCRSIQPEIGPIKPELSLGHRCEQLNGIRYWAVCGHTLHQEEVEWNYQDISQRIGSEWRSPVYVITDALDECGYEHWSLNSSGRILRETTKALERKALVRRAMSVFPWIRLQRVAILFMMIFPRSASAESQYESSRKRPDLTGKMSILEVVQDLSRQIIEVGCSFSPIGMLDTDRQKLSADPHSRDSENRPSPEVLLLGCFLWTSFAVTTAYLHKDDSYQRYFLLASAVILAVEGYIFAVDVKDFVFRYMFLNISAGLGLSVLFHRGMALLNDKSQGMQAVEKPTGSFSENGKEEG